MRQSSSGEKTMAGWQSYDGIAERYEEVWGPRFDAAADHLVSRLRPGFAGRALDIGAGTGAALSALQRRFPQLALLVACDVSAPMLARARRRVADARVVRANAMCLPFRSGSFELATASFVLSHVPDYREALREAFRVLSSPSSFDMTNWAPATDPYISAWQELLGAAVGSSLVERASEEVAPWESHLADPLNLRAALEEAGFTGVTLDSVQIEIACSIEDYLADREISSTGRCARLVLGQPRWREFLEKTRGELETRFAGRVSYGRGVVLATGFKA